MLDTTTIITEVEMNASEKLILATITDLLGRGQKRIRHRLLSRLTHLSIPTIKRAVRRLEAGGFIRVKRTPGFENEYHLMDVQFMESDRGPGSSHDPPGDPPRGCNWNNCPVLQLVLALFAILIPDQADEILSEFMSGKPVSEILSRVKMIRPRINMSCVLTDPGSNAGSPGPHPGSWSVQDDPGSSNSLKQLNINGKSQVEVYRDDPTPGQNDPTPGQNDPTRGQEYSDSYPTPDQNDPTPDQGSIRDPLPSKTLNINGSKEDTVSGGDSTPDQNDPTPDQHDPGSLYNDDDEYIYIKSSSISSDKLSRLHTCKTAKVMPDKKKEIGNYRQEIIASWKKTFASDFPSTKITDRLVRAADFMLYLYSQNRLRKIHNPAGYLVRLSTTELEDFPDFAERRKMLKMAEERLKRLEEKLRREVEEKMEREGFLAPPRTSFHELIKSALPEDCPRGQGLSL